MQAMRITRRQALAVGVSTILATASVAVPVPKDDANKSWVGKTVLPKKYAAIIMAIPSYVPPDGKWGEAPWTLLSASQTVKNEKGTRVELLDDDKVGWIEKDQLVPLAEADEFFTKALKANEKDTFAPTLRGWAFYLLGKPDKAIADIDQFLKLTPAGMAVAPGTPARWEGLVNRGLVFAEEGEFEKALKDLDEAVKGWPAIEIARINRGYTYELMGQYQKALDDYDRVAHPKYGFGSVGRKGGMVSNALAMNDLAWLRATCPDAKFRDGKEATEIAKLICEQTRDREGMYLDTLAASYAEAGKFAEAVKTQEKALADKSFALRYGEEAQKRLKLYQNKKPYRTEVVKRK